MLESKNLRGNTPMVIPQTWVPPKSLADLNLEDELLQQLNSTKSFLAGVMTNEDIAPNQIAQVMNTLASITKQIISMQEALHNQESIKKMEAAMIFALKQAPTDVQDAFLLAYESAQ